ncbi:MAG: alkyl hydroperoxide reductase [Gaiellales bacterium]
MHAATEVQGMATIATSRSAALHIAKVTLAVAAVYNILFGAWAVLLPASAFDFAGLEQPNYPELWQCIGMIVGVYGIGYAIAARDPIRHWPIVLVGLLGKILGPIGFLGAVLQDRVPLQAGLIIVTTDLIWWPGFAIALWLAWRARTAD